MNPPSALAIPNCGGFVFSILVLVWRRSGVRVWCRGLAPHVGRSGPKSNFAPYPPKSRRTWQFPLNVAGGAILKNVRGPSTKTSNRGQKRAFRTLKKSQSPDDPPFRYNKFVQWPNFPFYRRSITESLEIQNMDRNGLLWPNFQPFWGTSHQIYSRWKCKIAL